MSNGTLFHLLSKTAENRRVKTAPSNKSSSKGTQVMTSFRSVINGSTESVVLAVNLGHDGAVAVLQDGSLEFSIEAEKNSYPRYSTAGPTLLFDAFQQLKRSPDIVAIGGWRQDDVRDDHEYFGTAERLSTSSEIRLFGQTVTCYRSTHERSHIFCAYGMSPFPQGQPCYVLVWEGSIGRFYEIDRALKIKRMDQVLPAPGY
jgi:predicted NodU family carbamoyl transferase